MTNPMDQYLPAFLQDAYATLENIRSALLCIGSDINKEHAIYEVMRLFHSLKSASAMMGFLSMSKLCEHEEGVFKDAYQGKTPVALELQQEAMATVDHIRLLLRDLEAKGPDFIRELDAQR